MGWRRATRRSERHRVLSTGACVVPIREIAAHHSFLSPFIRRQVAEKRCGYGGSIEPMAVVRDAFRKEQRLQPLLVVERRLHPQV